MHRQLPAILKCIFCSWEGLRLSESSKIAVLGDNEIVLTGKVECPHCGATYPIQDGILNFLPVRAKNIGPGQRTNHNRLVAWGYERLWRPRALSALGGRPWPPEEELATIIRMLAVPEPEKLTLHNELAFYLDQGCSTCFYGRAIGRAFDSNEIKLGSAEGHVVAVDNSWQMLQASRGFISRDHLEGRISLVRADVEQLPFIEAAFAGVASGGSLNEFRHTDRALAEARRTLAQYGRAALMVQMHARGKIGGAINDLLHLSSGIHFFTREQLNRYYTSAGFRVVEQQAEGLITISQLLPKG